MRSKWLISLGLVVCLVMCFALPMCAPAPPVEEEPELVSSIALLSTWTDVYIDEVCEFADEKLGVTIEPLILSCGEVGARQKAEAPYFTMDMTFGVCSPEAQDAKENGWVVAYDSPTWREAGPMWKDPDNYWWSIANWSFILMGNSELLAKEGVTIDDFKSWDDLLDPRWEGEIVMPSPYTSGTAYLIMCTFMFEYGFNRGEGEEGGWEYLEALNKNIHHYTRSGSAPADLVGKGEFALGISYDEACRTRTEEGYPIEWTIPEEGTGYDTSPCWIFKTTTGDKLYTCQKLIDLFGTHEFCQMSAEVAGFQTKDPEVISPFYGGMPKYVDNFDLAYLIKGRDKLTDEWLDKIGRVPAE